MKIAIFIPSLEGGGAERVTVALANGLAKLGCSVDLVLGEKKGVYLQDIKSEVNVVDLKRPRVSRAVFPLSRYLRLKKPDVLVSALEHTNLSALLARILSGQKIKTCVTVHSSPVCALANQPSKKGRMVYLLGRLFYRFADVVVAVAAGVGKELIIKYGVSTNKLKVIYNPVFNEDTLKKALEKTNCNFFDFKNKRTVTAAGRLSKPKDYPTLLRAFSIVRQTKDVHLLILGEGPEREALEKLVKDLGLVGFVHMPGFCSNPYAYVKRSDLFVLSSAWEALPTALIEALALKMPIVATDCNYGPREILEDGKLGALVTVGDPVALAEAIVSTWGSKPSFNADVLRKYTIDFAAKQYLDLFKEIVND